jgi:hypothetical protein
MGVGHASVKWNISFVIKVETIETERSFEVFDENFQSEEL